MSLTVLNIPHRFGVKTVPSEVQEMEPNFKQGSFSTMEEEQYPETVSKQRGIPSGRSRFENTIYPENEGPTRDCDIFGLGELDSKWNCDGESKAGFSTTTLEYPEQKCDVSDLQRHRLGDENVSTNVQDCKNAVEDWEGDARSRISKKRVSAMYEELNDNDEECRARVPLPPAEGNLVGRITDAVRKNERVKSRKKVVDDQDQTKITKNDEVLGQLGNQITKLEKSIRMMKPEVNKKTRSNGVGNDYVLQNIESLLKEMKRSFDKIELSRRRSYAKKENCFFDDDARAESLVSVTEGSSFRSEAIEKEKFVGQLDLTILRSETLLEDQEELAPILTISKKIKERKYEKFVNQMNRSYSYQLKTNHRSINRQRNIWEETRRRQSRSQAGFCVAGSLAEKVENNYSPCCNPRLVRQLLTISAFSSDSWVK
ncbi:uncharacterized protein LOC124405961 [Diprion similis]|uniref:uncharacterized protein LOC124405961 n=1 Tax=Diprion similis TaxID=362088 RepID=UPI001EF8DEC3|nr:uncharacterized protein LOC124405961 [Diprion similis]